MPDAEVKRQLFEKGGQLFRRESGATAIGVNTREQVATARLVTRFAASALAWAVVCSACNRSSEKQPPTEPRRNVEAEVSALQLSQMCSTAAETFWRRGGYDHPSPPAKGMTDNWNYQSHYNTQQKRCLVLTERVTLTSIGSIQYQEVFDAFEGGEPLAILNVRRPNRAPEAFDLLRANAKIPSTPENLEWFRGLMSK